MATDPVPTDPRALWQRQPATGFRLSSAELRTKVARAHRRLRLMTIAQYAGSAVSLVAWGAIAVRFADPFMRVGALLVGLVFAHLLFVMWATRRAFEVARLTGVPADPSLASYRADLARQRDLSSGRQLSLRFALAVPAACTFFYGFVRAYPELARFIYVEWGAFLVVMPIAYLRLRRRARRYQRQIDELDALA